MNTQDKSFKLAELMGLTDRTPANSIYHYVMWNGKKTAFTPYYDTDIGRAQFTAILLKNGAMTKRVMNELHNNMIPLTQESFLDELLRMNGVEV